ncbi:hypothetical protein PAPYR_10336 [Paratrimastix pyriformis]|uniref:Uncharacterized protein n=1 Tax=Paratrimastix pyriformis TaxID=342808 RepID=A0ABQ8U643_9EUKA|nr:hypothetical protein PAPYR_10336 [Paratrimastix pyriformis]
MHLLMVPRWATVGAAPGAAGAGGIGGRHSRGAGLIAERFQEVKASSLADYYFGACLKQTAWLLGERPQFHPGPGRHLITPSPPAVPRDATPPSSPDPSCFAAHPAAGSALTLRGACHQWGLPARLFPLLAAAPRAAADVDADVNSDTTSGEEATISGDEAVDSTPASSAEPRPPPATTATIRTAYVFLPNAAATPQPWRRPERPTLVRHHTSGALDATHESPGSPLPQHTVPNPVTALCWMEQSPRAPPRPLPDGQQAGSGGKDLGGTHTLGGLMRE